MKKQEKPHVFILHGWTYDLEKWRPFINSLDSLGISSTLLKIPGLTTRLDKVWKIDDYISWLENEFYDESDIILIGHSFGGNLAVRFAAKFPAKVNKLIIIDCGGIIDRSLVKIIKRIIFFYLAKIGKLVFSNNKFRTLLYKLARENDYFNASPNMRKTMTNIIKKDLAVILDKVKTPTLIIWGEMDKITPLKFADIFNKNIKNSQLNVIKGAKHSPQFSHTIQVVKHIEKYLS